MTIPRDVAEAWFRAMSDRGLFLRKETRALAAAMAPAFDSPDVIAARKTLEAAGWTVTRPAS